MAIWQPVPPKGMKDEGGGMKEEEKKLPFLVHPSSPHPC
jgi:hypothetical protein